MSLDKNAVHQPLTDHLHMWKICAKVVPKNLSVEQKANRLEICQDLLGRSEIEPDFLDKVITGDESRVINYDPETKQQSVEWHTKSSPRPKKAHISRSRVKTMIIVFSTAVALCTNNLYFTHHLQRCLGTTSKTGPASPNGHCRRLGAAPQ